MTIVFHKLWRFLRMYILTIPRFDLFLQGALLIVVLLDNNVYLLLQREISAGHLPGLTGEWVYMGAAGVELVMGAVLAWYGRDRRQFAVSFWLGLTAAVSLLVLAFPYTEDDIPSVELCGGEAVAGYSEYNKSNTVTRIFLLILTAFLCALTKISVWAHGVTYLDDHEPQNGPYFYGILVSIRLSLGINGMSWLLPGSRREDWWEAHLSLSSLTLMFAILFTLFPSKMPQYQEVEEKEDTGFISTFARVISNKAVIIQTCALSLMNAALFGFIKYDPYFVQARFHIEAVRQDPQTSRAVGDIFRSLVIIFFVSVFRVRFSVRRGDGVKANTASRVGGVVAVLVAVFFTVVAVLSCELDEIAGMNGDYEQPECSQECGCNSHRYGYSPVCAIDTYTTYFTPCHAGCNQYENLNGFTLFHNCTCFTERAVRGSCTLPTCRTVYSLYQVFYAVVVALSAASLLMQGMVIVRSVRRVDKPLAIGLSFALTALLSKVPGNLLYMLISYLTCAYSNDNVCVFHRPTFWSLAAVSAILSLLSAVISLIASKAEGDPGLLIAKDDDDDDDNDDNS